MPNTRYPKLLAIAAAVAVTTLSLFYVASLATEHVDRAHYRAAVSSAVHAGVLARPARLPFASGRQLSVVTFNDCLILSMLILERRDSAPLAAISPIIPAQMPTVAIAPAGYPGYVQCANLAATLAEPARVASAYYHRYLHGDWVLAKAMLAVLPLAAAGHLLLAGVVVLLTAVSVAGLCRARQSAALRARGLAYAVLAAGWLTFGAHNVFGRSFSFAPANLVISCVLLVFCWRAPSMLSERALTLVCALFGSLIAMFEFLTGPLPEGIMVLLAVVAIDTGNRQDLMRRTAISLAAFGGAALFCFVLKMALVAAIWGGAEVDVFSRQLGARVGGGGWDIAPENAAILSRLGLDIGRIQSSIILSYLYALAKVAFFARDLAFGSHTLGTALLLLPIIILAIRLWRSSASTEDDRWRLILLLGACTVMPIWYFVFLQHTIIHAHFMYRPAIWPLLIVGTYEVWMAVQRAGGQPATE